jgi:flagellar motor switch/type III secretory pathway protein FliN
MSEPQSKPAPSRYLGFEEIPIRVTVRVGHARTSLARLSNMKEGEVIRLDRAVGAPFELLAGEIELGTVELVASDDAIALKLIAAREDEDDSAL